MSKTTDINFHYVSVYAVGRLKDDDTHYFEAFFKTKTDASKYINGNKFLSIFDLSYRMPKDIFLKSGDFFIMPGDKGIKYGKY